MNINEALIDAQKHIEMIDSKLDGLVLKGDLKSRIVYALRHLSLSHYSSFVLLMRSKKNASAAALLRPQYEALIRSLYLDECATDKEIEYFSNRKEPKKLYEMVKLLDAEWESKTMSNSYRKLKNVMNSYTHGGIEQLEQRFTADELIENFSDAKRIQLLTLSKNYANITAYYAAVGLGREDLGNIFINDKHIKNEP